MGELRQAREEAAAAMKASDALATAQEQLHEEEWAEEDERGPRQAARKGDQVEEGPGRDRLGAARQRGGIGRGQPEERADLDGAGDIEDGVTPSSGGASNKINESRDDPGTV